MLFKVYDGKKLCFPVKSFPRLQFLVISCAAQLNQFEIEEGALTSLVELRLIECPELKCFPYHIEYLAALEKLALIDTAEELIEKLRQKHDADEYNEEVMKISHVKMVDIMLCKKKIWERIH